MKRILEPLAKTRINRFLRNFGKVGHKMQIRIPLRVEGLRRMIKFAKRVKKRSSGFLQGALLYLLLLLALPSCEKKKTACEIKPPTVHTWNSIRQIEDLYMLLAGFGIDSLIDIPSKDLEPELIKELGVKDYIGIAKSRDEACAMQARYGDETLNFFRYDITSEILPKKKLILCWDYLFTLKQSDVKASLWLFKKSGAKYLLMSHDPLVKTNKKNRRGERVSINWQVEPYSFPKPILQIRPSQNGGILALWKLEDIF